MWVLNDSDSVSQENYKIETKIGLYFIDLKKKRNSCWYWNLASVIHRYKWKKIKKNEPGWLLCFLATFSSCHKVSNMKGAPTLDLFSFLKLPIEKYRSHIGKSSTYMKQSSKLYLKQCFFIFLASLLYNVHKVTRKCGFI